MSDDNDDEKVPPKEFRGVTRISTDLEKFTRLVRQSLHEADAQQQSQSEETNAESTDSDAGPLPLVPTGESATIIETIIGLGLMTVGLATLVAVAFLPHRMGSWIFVVAAIIFMGGGARRIDRATRAHRRAIRQSKQNERFR